MFSVYVMLRVSLRIFIISSDSLSLLGESEEYLEHDSYLEEEDLISSEDVMQDSINSNRHLFKRRRLFRHPRERQRGKERRNIMIHFMTETLTVISPPQLTLLLIIAL